MATGGDLEPDTLVAWLCDDAGDAAALARPWLRASLQHHRLVRGHPGPSSRGQRRQAQAQCLIALTGTVLIALTGRALATINSMIALASTTLRRPSRPHRGSAYRLPAEILFNACSVGGVWYFYGAQAWAGSPCVSAPSWVQVSSPLSPAGRLHTGHAVRVLAWFRHLPTPMGMHRGRAPRACVMAGGGTGRGSRRIAAEAALKEKPED
jgi:hypothetical protein